MPNISKYAKYARAGVIFAVLIVILVLAIAGGGNKTSPTPKTPSVSEAYRSDRVVRISNETINVEVPTTEAQFEKGLGGRPSILPNQGMLFIFKKPGQYPFWMKGMKFPIDIVWISADHKVAGLEIDVKPSTYPDRFVNKLTNPAQYVLELKANRSKDLHITLGTPIQF